MNPSKFQSTLPAREATSPARPKAGGPVIFQSTLPAREATRGLLDGSIQKQISIHASREGSDHGGYSFLTDKPLFQSTLPAREATSGNPTISKRLCISIHASREGSDVLHADFIPLHLDFNPRFPRGKRRGKESIFFWVVREFQSTLPAREAT